MRTKTIGTSLLAAVIIGCGSSAAQDEAPTPPADDSIERIAGDLEAEHVDTGPWSRALSEGQTAEAAATLLPKRFEVRLIALRDKYEPPAPATTTTTPKTLEPKILSSRGSSDRVAVVLIANANPNKIARGVAEWVARAYFDVHMARHYAKSHVCIGDGGTWGCFRDGLVNDAAGFAAVDVIIESHGFFAGQDSVAFDNDNVQMKATDALASPNQEHYRFGMFMPCFAARDDKGGFAQVWLALGGRSSYGSREISTPASDVIFQSRFGTFNQSFGDAVNQGNAHPLDQIAQAWGKKEYEPFTTKPKEAFGNLDAHMTDGAQACADGRFLGGGDSCDDPQAHDQSGGKGGGCSLALYGAPAPGAGLGLAGLGVLVAFLRRRRGRQHSRSQST